MKYERVKLTSGNLLPLFDQLKVRFEQQHGIVGAPPISERDLRLVQDILSMVTVPEGQIVALATAPAEHVVVAVNGAEGPLFFHEEIVSDSILMKTERLGAHPTDISDEAFARQVAQTIRGLMRDEHGNPWTAFIIYTMCVGPETSPGTGTMLWRMRCAAVGHR